MVALHLTRRFLVNPRSVRFLPKTSWQIQRTCHQAPCPADQSRFGFTRRKSDAWSETDLAVLPHHLKPSMSETLDLILHQKIYMLQARRGYRANIDSHLLAYFASCMYNKTITSTTPKRPLRVLDIGAGVGTVSILFAKAHPPYDLHMLELQPQLADRARRNLQLNNLNGIVTQHDVQNGHLPCALHAAFDVVVVNPPFYRHHSRRPPSTLEKELAFFESSATLSDFMSVARLACDSHNPHAFIAVIHDINEKERVHVSVRENDLLIRNVQEVCHNEVTSPARILLHLLPMDTRKADDILIPGENGMTPTLQSLMLHPSTAGKDEYSDEIERFLQMLPNPLLKIGRLREANDY